MQSYFFISSFGSLIDGKLVTLEANTALFAHAYSKYCYTNIQIQSHTHTQWLHIYPQIVNVLCVARSL